MATPAQNLETEYANWCAKLAEVSANPRPDYTLPGGASVKFGEYYKFLQEARDKARAALLAAQGPFEVIA